MVGTWPVQPVFKLVRSVGISIPIYVSVRYIPASTASIRTVSTTLIKTCLLWEYNLSLLNVPKMDATQAIPSNISDLCIFKCWRKQFIGDYSIAIKLQAFGLRISSEIICLRTIKEEKEEINQHRQLMWFLAMCLCLQKRATNNRIYIYIYIYFIFKRATTGFI